MIPGNLMPHIIKRYTVLEPGTTEHLKDHPLVDCETRSCCKDEKGLWKNHLCFPYIYGILTHDMIIQIIDLVEDTHPSDAFKSILKIEIENLPQPFYGLNKDFEYRGLLNSTGLRIKVEDVRDMKGKLSSKKYLYDLLIKHKGYPVIDDPFDFESSKCIEAYKKYHENYDLEMIENAIIHNTNCLIMESAILKHKDFLTSLFNIDNKGWVTGLKL